MIFFNTTVQFTLYDKCDICNKSMDNCQCLCCICNAKCNNGLEICDKCVSTGQWLCIGCMQQTWYINDIGMCTKCACSFCGHKLCYSVCKNPNCNDD